MPLPKLNTATFEVLVPSLGQKIKMRMMKGKEEKILLIAKESKDNNDIFEAVKQVLNNCIIDNKTYNVEKFALFDIEYLFLKLRSISVDNMIDLNFNDEDGKTYPVRIDLQEVEVNNLPKSGDTKWNVVEISDNIHMTMKYPSGKIYSDKNFIDKGSVELADILIADSMDKLYEGDKVFDFKTCSFQEKIDFIEDLDIKSLEKIRDFMAKLPEISHTVSYVNSNGVEKSYTLRTLTDFFTLR